jgi:hypothetical protein
MNCKDGRTSLPLTGNSLCPKAESKVGSTLGFPQRTAMRSEGEASGFSVCAPYTRTKTWADLLRHHAPLHLHLR